MPKEDFSMSSIGSFFRILSILWKNADKLAPLFERLPDALAAAGGGMVLAGNVARSVSCALKGDGSNMINAKKAVDDVISNVETCVNTLNGIEIPTLNASGTNLMGVYVITDLGIGKIKPLSAVGDKLNDVVVALRDLSNKLGQAGNDLSTLSQDFNKVGSALQGLDSSTLPPLAPLPMPPLGG